MTADDYRRVGKSIPLAVRAPSAAKLDRRLLAKSEECQHGDDDDNEPDDVDEPVHAFLLHVAS